MTDNMKVWNSIPKTDQEYTKQSKEQGRTVTSAAPVYMVKLATAALGPIGVGWGYEIVEERFDNTLPIILIEGDKSKGTLPVYMMDGGNIVWEKTHTALLKMWVGEKGNSFVQYGHTKYSYMTKAGKFYVDHEYGKKSVTDAMTKCLSLLGVCSDIYMGQFDNIEYKELAKLENDLAKADSVSDEVKSKTEELRKHISDHLELMGECPTFEAAAKVYGLATTKVNLLSKSLGLNAQDELKDLDAKYFEMKSVFNKGDL